MIDEQRAIAILNVFDLFRNEIRHRFPPRTLEAGGQVQAASTLTLIYFNLPVGPELEQMQTGHEQMSPDEIAKAIEARRKIMEESEDNANPV